MSRPADSLGNLRGDDEDADCRDESCEKLRGHQVGEATKPCDPNQHANDTHKQGQQSRKRYVVTRLRFRDRRERREGQQGREGDRPRLEVAGRHEERSNNGWQRRRIETVDRWHPCNLRVSQRLWNDHDADAHTSSDVDQLRALAHEETPDACISSRHRRRAPLTVRMGTSLMQGAENWKALSHTTASCLTAFFFLW